MIVLMSSTVFSSNKVSATSLDKSLDKFESVEKKVANDANDIMIGVQLWSVKDTLNKDFKGTIESLAKMGFSAVEFAGVFGEFERDPAGLKSYLSKVGLSVSGAHISFDALSEDKIANTLKFYKALGANYLVIGWDERAWHPIEIHDFVAELNHFYPLVSAAGFEFGFHNHAQEFNDFTPAQHGKRQTYWDFIATQTDPNMILQLDIGWVNYAGKDPHHYVKTYQGRTLTTHYKVRTHKDEHKTPLLGKDGYDWLALFNLMRQVGGTKWVIVEQEEYPDGLSSLEAVAQSKAGLDKLLFN